MRMTRVPLALLLAAGFALAPAALAKSIKVYTNDYGWEPGDRSETRSADGLDVSFKIDYSPNNGRMYVRAKFCNDNSSDWQGGIRVTVNYPDNAHARIRVPGGDCKTWSEHLPLNARDIYILVDRAD